MTDEIPLPLPSRPPWWESTLLACGICGLGLWLALGLGDAMGAKAERDSEIARAREEGDAASLGDRRFALREGLVDANVELVRAFVAGTSDVAPEELTVAVEALAASAAAATDDVVAVLTSLVEHLDALEEDEGYLDTELEAARTLARESLTEREN